MAEDQVSKEYAAKMHEILDHFNDAVVKAGVTDVGLVCTTMLYAASEFMGKAKAPGWLDKVDYNAVTSAMSETMFRELDKRIGMKVLKNL